MARGFAMSVLGNGLSDAKHHKDALSVREAELATMRRLDDSEDNMLIAQCNLACTYRVLGRHEEALQMKRDVYSGRLKLNGEEHEETLVQAYNYAVSLYGLQRYEETKALLRKTMPVARRVLGELHRLALKMRWLYARALYMDKGVSLDDRREAVATLESVANSWKRVFGQAHPETPKVQGALKEAREALAERLAASVGSAS